MNTLNLSVDLVNAVMNYLGSRPYQEVTNLIDAIRKEAAPQLPAPEAEAAPVEDAPA